METGINLSAAKADPASVTAIATAIESVFESGAKNCMDQETVRCALGIVQEMGCVKGATISHSQIHGGTTINVPTPEDDFGSHGGSC